MRTDREAISQISAAIEANGTARADEYDVRAILDATHEFTPRAGFVQTATVEEFWEAVGRNEKAPTEAGAFHPR
ncbi:hypothetical protein [Agromyces larvae]|uniref:Uncharacterized protein n=1 Tax=Agromyces larvae TaxID=2929802 RepID=A0ABY4C772_9MICO|nr:hypothetical protein [Agromyces larvae]UOE45941.1 hypothetical protein MTO99_09430 [Agromyces larvae]